jgi:hypothetical protein
MKTCIVAVLIVCSLRLGLAQPLPPLIQRGDILYLDSGDAIAGAYVVKLDPHTGQRSIIVSHLASPEGIAMDNAGNLLISSYSSVIRVDPSSGIRELIADAGKFGGMYSLALSPQGDVYASFMVGRQLGPHRDYFPECVNHDPKFKLSSGIVQIDSATGGLKTVSTSRLFYYPIGVAIGDKGDIFVNNIAFPGEILRVNPKGGAAKIVSAGNYLHFPLGIVVSGRFAYVTDVATDDQNFGIGTIVRVDIETGAQKLLAVGDNLLKPVGITLDLDGQLIVTDPYTINPASPNLYDGGIIRIDPQTGAQTLLARGQGNIVNPGSVTVVK